MGNLTDDEIGALTEGMFLHAVTQRKPEWVVAIERAPLSLDLHAGMDFILRIRYRDDREGRVPVQIKSQERWKREYYEKYPNARTHEVICLVVSPTDHLITVREKFYPLLSDRRDREIWYEGYINAHAHIVRGKQSILETKVKNMRDLRPTNPHNIVHPGLVAGISDWWKCRRRY